MTAQVSQQPTPTGVTPSALTPASTDTVLDGQFGPTGIYVRITTTTTACSFSVSDPTPSGLGNPGTVTPISIPTSSTRKFFVPRAAISLANGYATLNFSATTGVSYEMDRV